jgi:hypothetical protein
MDLLLSVRAESGAGSSPEHLYKREKHHEPGIEEQKIFGLECDVIDFFAVERFAARNYAIAHRMGERE